MIRRIPHLAKAVSVAILASLPACTASQPTVVEKLDEKTAVTITYGRATMEMGLDPRFDPKIDRDSVHIGAIEVNRVGTIRYYLWLGITEVSQTKNETNHPEGFDSVVLIADTEKIRLDVYGWSADVIGAGEPVYTKLFPTSAEAYYVVTLDQIQLLADSGGILLRTSGSTPKEFVPSFGQAEFKNGLAEFLRTVSR